MKCGPEKERKFNHISQEPGEKSWPKGPGNSFEGSVQELMLGLVSQNSGTQRSSEKWEGICLFLTGSHKIILAQNNGRFKYIENVVSISFLLTAQLLSQQCMCPSASCGALRLGSLSDMVPCWALRVWCQD